MQGRQTCPSGLRGQPAKLMRFPRVRSNRIVCDFLFCCCKREAKSPPFARVALAPPPRRRARRDRLPHRTEPHHAKHRHVCDVCKFLQPSLRMSRSDTVPYMYRSRSAALHPPRASRLAIFRKRVRVGAGGRPGLAAGQAGVGASADRITGQGRRRHQATKARRERPAPSSRHAARGNVGTRERAACRSCQTQSAPLPSLGPPPLAPAAPVRRAAACGPGLPRLPASAPCHSSPGSPQAGCR